jgi:hypothetical protein
LKLLPADVIEDLLGRTPAGEFPRNAIPSPLYKDIIEWRPVLGEAEPLAAIQQHNMMSFRRDPDYNCLGDCTGVPISHERIFQAFGMTPQAGWNRGINSGMLLELYCLMVDAEFDWTKWNGENGKARVITKHGIPSEIMHKAKETMLGPGDYDDWTVLVNGRSANRRTWTAELRKERLNDIEENEPIIEPPEATKEIQAYLNGLDQTTFSHGGHGILCGDVLDRGIEAVQETIAEEQRRHQELRKLYWMRKFPQPLYLPCDRFPRLRCDYHNQAMNLPSEVLRSMYHERDYELDLSKAHLASYVPVAKREGLGVPTLERYLDANLTGDTELLMDGDLWMDLAMTVDADVFDDIQALRDAVKRAYSAVYGSGRQNILYRIYQKYGKFTGHYPDEGLEPLRPILDHPLMQELLETRDKLELIINQRGGLENANGRFIPLYAWDETKKEENRWRGVMAYVNASYEQELMLPIFQEARSTMEREAYTEFRVWLYQADGVTVRMHRNARNHSDIIVRLQSAVEEKARELGVPTELEVDYPG